MPDNSQLLNADDLKRWYGVKRTADVIRYLNRDRIAFTTGRDGDPCTTLDSVNRALQGDGDSVQEFDFRAEK